MLKKRLTKKERQMKERIKLLTKEQNSHRRFNKEQKIDTFNNLMKWNKMNLSSDGGRISPNGGVKPFKVNKDD